MIKSRCSRICARAACRIGRRRTVWAEIGRIMRVGRIAEHAGARPPSVVAAPTGVVGRCRCVTSMPARATAARWRYFRCIRPRLRRGTVRRSAGRVARHADALLVTGVVTRNMAQPLRNTLEATPAPRVVIACGDCALNRGVFADAYGVVGAVGEVVPSTSRCRLPADSHPDCGRAAFGDRPMTVSVYAAAPVTTRLVLRHRGIGSLSQGATTGWASPGSARTGRGAGRLPVQIGWWLR